MPKYSFRAISETGAAERGVLEAESEAAALDAIARRGLIPVSLLLSKDSEAWWNRELTLFAPAGQLPPPELERFFSTLGALLRAQVPLPQALAISQKLARQGRARRALVLVSAAVENGSPFAVALRSAGNAFPERLIAMVASGEAAGRLSDVISRIAEMIASETRISRTLRGALVYPVILLVMSIAVMAVIVFHLAPTLLPVFESAGAASPAVLIIAARAGELIIAIWPLLLVAGLGFSVVILAVRAQSTARFSNLLLRLPVSGPHLRRRETLRFCQSMLLMLSGGAVVLHAIGAAKTASTVPAYRALLSDVEDRVMAGGTLVEALQHSRLIDDFAMTLIAAGEESNRLVEGFGTAVDVLEGEVTQKLGQAIQLLAPVLTLVIGVAVGGVILATVSAIMDLNDINF
jgi:general secretion pathway protein F